MLPNLEKTVMNQKKILFFIFGQACVSVNARNILRNMIEVAYQWKLIRWLKMDIWWFIVSSEILDLYLIKK